MTAHVVKAADGSLARPHDEEVLAEKVHEEVGAGVRDRLLSPDAHPVAEEDPFAFEFEERFRPIGPSRKGRLHPGLGIGDCVRVHGHVF